MEDKGKKIVRFKTECYEAGITHRFNIYYYVFQDEGLYIAYCPALDITTSGKDFNDAVAQFYENFQLYVECCVEDGTLIDDLIDHGWKLEGVRLTPPSLDDMLLKPEFKSLIGGDKEYDKLNAPLQLQVV